jgi:CRP-like cAMP-binding protein
MNIDPLIKHLHKHISLTSDEVEILSRRVSYRKYLKGQFIVQHGEVCKYENYIVKGCCKTFYNDEDGHEHIVMFAIEDWWTADLGSFLTQTPADYNVLCLEETEVIQITYHNLEKLYEEIPKLERFFRIIVQKAFVASEKRIIRNFSMPAKERYLQFQRQYPQIEQRIPQYLIASYLGITKEFLSKIRNQLMGE